jgi:hypothetical protein
MADMRSLRLLRSEVLDPGPARPDCWRRAYSEMARLEEPTEEEGRSAEGAGRRNGKTREKVEPSPRTDLTESWPPIVLTIRAVVAKPSPRVFRGAVSLSGVLERSETCSNSRKSRSRLASSIPLPVSVLLREGCTTSFVEGKGCEGRWNRRRNGGKEHSEA